MLATKSLACAISRARHSCASVASGRPMRRWIRPLCRAAKAVGAHGIIVEVHPNPPEAKSDKEQALTFDDFRQIMADLDKIPHAMGILA